MGKIRKLYETIRSRIRLWDMDRRWYMSGGNCFGLYPPSFYETHTPEEADRITVEEIERLRKLLDEPD